MLFSVIVPIYNVEKYIRRCIDSVLAQSYEDFELILVDDGSLDNCPEICDSYAAKDARIRVIHKKNGGLVSARQAGITASQGEYIFNLDGDDAITSDALQAAYEIIRDTDADIVSFSYKRYEGKKGGATVDDIVKSGFYGKEDIEKHVFPLLLSNKSMTHAFYFLWGRAIRRSLIYENQLGVNTAIAVGEDVSCIVPCFLQAQTAYFSNKAVYLYTIRDDSLSTDFKTCQITQTADTIIGLRGLEIPKMSDFDQQLARYSCFMCFAILAAAAEGGHFEAAKEIKKLILNSVHKDEIPKAEFENITVKSRIGIFLIKKYKIEAAFYFLYFCKKIKSIIKKG